MERHDDIGTTKDLVLYRLEAAKENLDSAKILLKAGAFKAANNRAYYAIFDAVNAIHALNGNAYKRHKDVIGNFNKEYVKTGIFSRTLGRKISEAEEIRHASDYDDFYIATKTEAEEQIETAENFIQEAEKYCREHIQ